MIKKKFAYFLFLFAALILTGSTWQFGTSLNHQSACREGMEQFQNTILTIQQDLQRKLNRPDPFHYFFSEKAQKHHQALFEFNGDTLKQWTSNTVAVEHLTTCSNGLHLIKNAWYIVAVREKVDSRPNDIIPQKMIATQRVRTFFDQENSYLENKFSPAIGLGNEWKLAQPASEHDFSQVVSENAKGPIFLEYDPTKAGTSDWIWASMEVSAVLGILLAMVFWSRQKNSRMQWLVVIGLILFRWLLMQDLILPHVKAFKLFLPQLYADSDWIPSLGDLILHVLTLLAVYFVFTIRKDKDKPPALKDQLIRPLHQGALQKVLLLIFLSVAGNGLNYLVHSLLFNSQVVLDVSDFSRIDVFTFVIYGILFLLFFLYYKYLSLVVQVINAGKGALYWMVAFAAAYGSWNELNGYSWDSYAWSFILVLLAYHKLLINQLPSGVSFFKYFPELLIVSMFLSLQVEKKELAAQQNEIEQLLAKKAQERDFVAEFLLQQLDEQLSEYLSEHLNDNSESITVSKEDLIAHLNSIFFSSYLKRFDRELSYFRGSDAESVLIQAGSFSPYTKIKGNLYRRLAGERIEYLLAIEKKEVKIALQFFAKEVPEGVGFPLLLADKGMGKVHGHHSFAYAKYKNGRLLEQEGGFNYPIESALFALNDSILSTTLIHEGHKHYLLNSNAKTYVVGQPKYNLKSLLNKLSYLVLFFIICSLLLFAAVRAIKHGVFWPQSFRGRLQFAILFVLFFSTLILAYGSIYFLKNRYNETAFTSISEKIKTVEKEINTTEFNITDSLFVSELNRLAATFDTDINLFNAQGQLINSTQKNIFEAGLLSRQMHPIAFKKLRDEKKSLRVQIEHIELMSYLSAYLPIYNKEGEFKAYLNLPYFSKTEELQSGINGFLVALINIYLLLTALSIALALLISNRITQPLKLIRDKISRLSFSKNNEQIAWSSNDEIGALVKEYNRMLGELSASANQLAQAEREGAWKEMAQQVAHEIKNPLTPMKLNIQHLAMRWGGLNEEDKKEAFDRLSTNLIEQIDTLSAIATQFSDFARIPMPNLIQLDLVPLLNNAAALYDGNKNVEVQLEHELSNCFVKGDKDQFIRILNNLLKNAVQAIPTSRAGIIQVTLKKVEKEALLIIRDNGDGIPQALQTKVFQPNFTTKTSGMGLGLAMVKQMLETTNGSISFESTEGVGTAFRVSFQLNEA